MAMDGRESGGVVASINVTPMADVMIVLLIIFMVATPLIGAGHGVQLPEARHGRSAEAPVVVSIAADTTTFLGDEALDTPGELLPRLQERLDAREAAERVVILKADARLTYATVATIVDLCRDAGATELALAIEPRS